MNRKTDWKGLSAAISRGLMMASMAVIWARAEGPARLPQFSLPDLDGKQWNSSQFIGKPLVVDFWATWCASCGQTVPKLAELSAKHKDKGLVVVGISVDKGSDAKIRKTAKKMGITYLVLHDSENSLSKEFGFTGIPSVYVFDREGKLKKALPTYDPDQEDQLIRATEETF